MFYSDSAIFSTSEDKLGRSGFSKQLARALASLNIKDTFSVGLFGKWGSGKTSLVNMMLNELEDIQRESSKNDDFVVVRFEPWNFSDSNQLLSQFFIRLSNELRSKGDETLAKIGAALENYSDAFDLAKSIPAVGEILAYFGKKSTEAVAKGLQKGSDENDVFKQKEYVINLLNKQSRRILVVIDDIDRLSNEQIRQVFQLITSVAKFPNMVYLLVFDKDIVVKALEDVQKGDGEDYLEKVIQIPIQVPDVQNDRLAGVLLNQLNDVLAKYEGVGFQNSHWNQLFEPCVKPFVTSIRDINRLCNSVFFKLTSIYSEVDFTDMVAISALEIFMPQVYDWVKNNESILTGGHDFSGVGARTSQQEWYNLYNKQLQALFAGQGAEKVNQNAQAAIAFLSHLFPYFGQKIGKGFEPADSSLLMKNNRIAHPEKFDRYFHLDVDNIVVRKSEILAAVYSLSTDDVRTHLLACDKNGQSVLFLHEVAAMTSEISSDRAKVIIEALLNTSAELDNISNRNLLSVGASSIANHMIPELLDVVVPTERLCFVSNMIRNADCISLSALANVINILELGHGRLAANGVERGYKKSLSLEELLETEGVFTQKVEALLQHQGLFDFDEWYLIAYLLECFDPDYIKDYLTEALKDDTNVARYLSHAVTAWSNTTYRITEQEYSVYLTEERILQAIDSLRHSGELFSLPEQVQCKCGAFFLWAAKTPNDHSEILQADVDQLLTSWKA